jgi:phosphotransferase system HPr (HPr) family protein
MKRQYRLEHQLGLHVRPAKQIVEAAKTFACDIALEKDGKRANAKSLVAVLSLGAKYGEEITVIAEGERAEEAQRMIGAIVTGSAEEPAKKD